MGTIQIINPQANRKVRKVEPKNVIKGTIIKVLPKILKFWGLFVFFRIKKKLE